MSANELTDELTAVRNAELLADVMGLQGAKAGPGDVWHALAQTGLELRAPADGATGVADLTDFRFCPKCGRPQRRLREGVDRGWWHERDAWGWERRCPS